MAMTSMYLWALACVAALICGIALCALLFLLAGFAGRAIKAPKAGAFLMPLVSLPFCALLAVFWPGGLNLGGALDAWALLTAAVSALLAAGIAETQRRPLPQSGLAHSVLAGICMELPQRFLMQGALALMLTSLGVPFAREAAVILNGLVWCAGIYAQALMTGSARSAKTLAEALSSFVFSLGVGFAYMRCDLILVPMAAHALERCAAYLIASIRGSKAKEN